MSQEKDLQSSSQPKGPWSKLASQLDSMVPETSTAEDSKENALSPMIDLLATILSEPRHTDAKLALAIEFVYCRECKAIHVELLGNDLKRLGVAVVDFDQLPGLIDSLNKMKERAIQDGFIPRSDSVC